MAVQEQMQFGIDPNLVKANAEAVIGQSQVGTNQISVGLAERGERLLLIFLGSVMTPWWPDISFNALTSIILLLIVASLITVIWRAVVIYKVVKDHE